MLLPRSGSALFGLLFCQVLFHVDAGHDLAEPQAEPDAADPVEEENLQQQKQTLTGTQSSFLIRSGNQIFDQISRERERD